MRVADSLSVTARRTSSCAKRYARRRPGSSTSSPFRTASSTASSRTGSRTTSALRTVSSSKSAPATAANASTSFVSAESRESRWLTTSRTVVGAPSSAAGRASSARPGPISIAPASSSSRQSSVTRNALPPVRSAIAERSSGAGSTPAASRTNSAISASDSPPRRIPRYTWCGTRRRASRRLRRRPRRRGSLSSIGRPRQDGWRRAGVGRRPCARRATRAAPPS